MLSTYDWLYWLDWILSGQKWPQQSRLVHERSISISSKQLEQSTLH